MLDTAPATTPASSADHRTPLHRRSVIRTSLRSVATAALWKLSLPLAASAIAVAVTVLHGPDAAAGRAIAPITAPPAAIESPQPEAQGQDLPHRRTFAPGETVDIQRGVAFLDPRTGSTEAWELPGAPAPGTGYPLAFEVSAGGRFIAYADQSTITNERYITPDALPWRLFNTRTGTQIDLPARPSSFSPDERRLLIPRPGALAVLDTATGAVVRTIDLRQFAPAQSEPVAESWSPDGRSVLVTLYGEDFTTVLVSVDSGATRLVGSGTRDLVWSPDSASYLVAGDTAVEAHATADGALLWSVTAAALQALGPVADEDLRIGAGLRSAVPSPDGASVAITASVALRRNGPLLIDPRVYVVDARTGALRFWVQGARTCEGLWTADSAGLLVWNAQGEAVSSYLVAADGAGLRNLGSMIEDLSPLDADLMTDRTFRDGDVTFQFLSITDRTERQAIKLTTHMAFQHHQRHTWLTDGRPVAYTPYVSLEGCLLAGYDMPPITLHTP